MTGRLIITSALIGSTVLLMGCNQTPNPAGTTKSSLKGTLLLQWDREDGFILVPDKSDPLTYRRTGFLPLTPGRMRTDGGSIPRIFWGFAHYSPWAYGPAYVLHDWLYHQHRCGVPTGYDFDTANVVLYDAIGILVKDGKAADPGGQVSRNVKWAVDTFGRKAWTDPCDPVPTKRSFSPPTTLMRFKF